MFKDLCLQKIVSFARIPELYIPDEVYFFGSLPQQDKEKKVVDPFKIFKKKTKKGQRRTYKYSILPLGGTPEC